MPKTLARSKNGKIPVADTYSIGQIAFMLGSAHRTATRLVDAGYIKGFRLISSPTKRLQGRRVLHSSLIAFIKAFPDYRFMLDHLEDYDPAKDFGANHKWPPNRIRRRKSPRRLKVEEELDASALVCDEDPTPEMT